MDYCFANQHDGSQIAETFQNVSSPEMFDSDTESDVDNRDVCALPDDNTLAPISPQKPSQAELVAKSDGYLLSRINKFLSGVPPPPRHTICQNDCSDFLQLIYKNHQYFWTGYPLLNSNLESAESTNSQKQITAEIVNRNIYQCTKGTPRNLTNAFDACNLPANNTENTQLSVNNNSDSSDNLSTQQSIPMEIRNPVNVIKEPIRVPSMVNSNTFLEQFSFFYQTINEKDATTLTWPQAYLHKFHGIQ